MKIVLSILSLLLLTSFASGQAKYAVNTISPVLLKNAHVVKRVEEVRMEIKNLTKAVYTRKFALTILDEAGQEYAEFVVGYDKLRKVESIEGALYDADGKQLKKVKGKEINDYSAISDISLFEDNRVKVHNFNHRVFPYTVEYEVELVNLHTFYFPSWMPQSYEHLAVEKSSYTFITPADYNLRYKAFNYSGQPVVSVEKDKKSYSWELNNLKPLVKPYASPAWNELTTTVYFAPTDFQMEDYKGNASTWEEFGKFILALNHGRDKLPDAIVQKVTALVDGVTDPKEKVTRLYQYLQQNTRYISIQLGIGGFQPFEASFVAQKGYGDCKALSNYMYSLLKATGIKSYHALINAGRDLDDKNLMQDLPSTQFNHMVLFVPLEKDTMWLECTDQDDPAGYAGSFTGNRKALAITEEGGKLVNTPSYSAADNLQVRSIKGKLDMEGNLDLSVATRYAAQQQDYYSSMINALSKEKLKKVLNERLDLSTYEINDFAYHAKKDRLPEVDEKLKITVANYATVSGKRLFIVPNIMSRSSSRVSVSEDRTIDFVFDDPYIDIDSVEIDIPSGYQVEAMPAEMNIKSGLGSYQSKVKLEGSKIIYYRRMERLAGRFPAREGANISQFFNDIYKADRSRIVLVKKEGEVAQPVKGV